MTIDQIIALSASVGAFLAAIATFLTVRQMVQQRVASYRPELVISRTHFEGSQDPVIPSHWVPKLSTQAAGEGFPFFSMPLVNVGLGTAKNLLIRWSFPIEEMVAQVNQLAQRTLTPVYFDLENGVLTIKSDTLGNGASIWRNQQEESLDYLLPVSIQKDSSVIRLPLVFVQLCSALLYLAAKDKDRADFPVTPILSAQIDFLDIGGKRHSTNYDISLQIVMFGGDGKFFHGYLESNKRS
ncbi:hypothetical protein MIZ01_0032 [Sideroxyarcus emersonii]|uniref:Uncharacterized protein n=1 Tax=Sideroxyarcus emersonii TaxID=2764705 RepID=A0AAN1X7L0_9PROT|nr:hypothetical protein [Sideroxyarcus emersonii]BCK86278.1 hypothetical protein MIZ01_0032 [Sideroxyarcus emersonii]